MGVGESLRVNQNAETDCSIAKLPLKASKLVEIVTEGGTSRMNEY